MANVNANDYGMNFSSYYHTSEGSISYQIKTGVGKFSGIWVSEVKAASTLTFYDNTSASGSAIMPTFSLGSSGSVKFYGPQQPVGFINGLYMVSTGSVIGTIYYY